MITGYNRGKKFVPGVGFVSTKPPAPYVCRCGKPAKYTVYDSNARYCSRPECEDCVQMPNDKRTTENE
jgi:hypothetical protein